MSDTPVGHSAQLGLASTRELLNELSVRFEMEWYHPGWAIDMGRRSRSPLADSLNRLASSLTREQLDYRTVGNESPAKPVRKPTA